MIRVLLVSDHPAIRAGLAHLIDSEAGMCVALADPALATSVPPPADVVLIDAPLSRHDAFGACHDLKQFASPRRVALYTHRPREELALAAWVAGADALIEKAAPAAVLFDQLRMVARGGRILSSPSARVLASAARELDPAERVVLGMCVYGVTQEEISRTLRRDPLEVEATVRELIRRLSEPAPRACPRPGRTPGRGCSPSRAPARPR